MWWQQSLDPLGLRSPNLSFPEALKNGFSCALYSLPSLDISPQIPAHKLDTQAEREKKDGDSGANGSGKGGSDDEWGERDEEKTAI